MRSDGRVFAVSEEWLSWLGRTLGDPPQNVPNRPRGWAKILLLRQVLANPPRRSEADAEAAGSVFFHDADYTMEYGLARREVAEWRDCLRLLDPLAADRDARVLEGLDAVCAAGAALRGGAGDEAAAAMPEAFERSGRSDRVARLAADVLKDLGRALDVAESMGDAAVRADSRSPHNLRVLGEVRLARGDAVGAADVLESAVEDPDGASLQPSRNTAWGRYVLARALTALGETEEALAAVGTAARLNDNLLYMAERDPAFAPLREGGRLDEALDEARRLFEE
jgi:tetratricopeptide (TPR) repeat protein